MTSNDLITFRKNIHSQSGEDGILEELSKRLSIAKGTFVEFGAWDGKHLSNTFHLLEQGWSGVHIEGDPIKFQDLLKTRQLYPNTLTPVCCYVDFQGENTLDAILSKTKTPKYFDILSIDIDSFDWQVWWSLKNYHPKIVIVESNTEILPGIFQVHTPGEVQGSSFTALLELGKKKGYALVCNTGNLIFVRNDLTKKVGLNEMYLDFPELLFDYRKHFEELKAQKSLKRNPKRFIKLFLTKIGLLKK
jgi:hypothetical protein